MKKEDKNFKNNSINVKKLIKKAKELKLIKPLTSAFENNNCKEEDHKGKKEYFYR